MCGRYEMDLSPDHRARRIGVELYLSRLWDEYWIKYASYDVRPETKRPVIAATHGEPALEAMRWGWRPAWLRGPLINARWETVPTKSTFKYAFKKGRCVVPATGYFEWRRDEKDKPQAKFLFRPADGGLLRIAGLWQETTIQPTHIVGHFGQGEIPPTVERRFLVLTREMKRYGDIHDRTPVILSPAAAEVWLDPSAPERDVFDAAAHLGDDHLVVRSVTFDKAAGKVDGPHLSQPLDGDWPWSVD